MVKSIPPKSSLTLSHRTRLLKTRNPSNLYGKKNLIISIDTESLELESKPEELTNSNALSGNTEYENDSQDYPEDYFAPHSDHGEPISDDTIDANVPEAEGFLYDNDNHSTDDLQEAYEEEYPDPNIASVSSTIAPPPPNYSQPQVDELSEPLDHLYYDDEDEEEVIQPPISPVKQTPQREYADIHWKQLTDKMPFVVWMLDEQRNCKYVNKKLRNFTGLPFEQLEGTGWSKTIHPEDYRKYAKYAETIVREQKPVGFAYRVRRADGLYRWMQETSIPLYDKADRFEGYLATSLDISKLKRVGALFAKALEGAINLEDIHSSLVPCLEEDSALAIADSIKVADALINNSQEMPQRELSTLMDLAGQRMLSLVNGMLGFSSIKPQKTELILREIDIRAVISNTVDMISPLRRREGPRFQVDTKSDTLLVQADKVMLHRSIENLIKGLQEAAESRVITIDFAQQNGFGVISIAHIGSILSDAFLIELANLYRDQQQLSLYQKKFGLHLSLIKKLCELMGGSLHVYSQEGIGPIISIQLKLSTSDTTNKAQQPDSSMQDVERVEQVNGEHHQRSQRPAVSRRVNHEKQPRVHQSEFTGGNRQQMAEVAEAISTLSPREAQAPKEAVKVKENGHGESDHKSSRQKILIGEHNRDTQRLIRSLLQPYYDLSIAPDIKAFLKQANESAFDLFLLDIHMRSDEGLHGVDILRQIRKMPQYRRTPVIAVASGNSGADKTELIERAGFDDFLRKPYSIVELLDTVEKVIES